ncbi:hypothetical protein J6590_063777 [Homalodisca vitripennis]|nr:hypothetical protein J6590_063777 [Homalodisca vitripennis]
MAEMRSPQSFLMDIFRRWPQAQLYRITPETTTKSLLGLNAMRAEQPENLAHLYLYEDELVNVCHDNINLSSTPLHFYYVYNLGNFTQSHIPSTPHSVLNPSNHNLNQVISKKNRISQFTIPVRRIVLNHSQFNISNHSKSPSPHSVLIPSNFKQERMIYETVVMWRTTGVQLTRNYIRDAAYLMSRAERRGHGADWWVWNIHVDNFSIEFTAARYNLVDRH